MYSSQDLRILNPKRTKNTTLRYRLINYGIILELRTKAHDRKQTSNSKD